MYIHGMKKLSFAFYKDVSKQPHIHTGHTHTHTHTRKTRSSHNIVWDSTLSPVQLEPFQNPTGP